MNGRGGFPRSAEPTSSGRAFHEAAPVPGAARFAVLRQGRSGRGRRAGFRSARPSPRRPPRVRSLASNERRDAPAAHGPELRQVSGAITPPSSNASTTRGLPAEVPVRKNPASSSDTFEVRQPLHPGDSSLPVRPRHQQDLPRPIQARRTALPADPRAVHPRAPSPRPALECSEMRRPPATAYPPSASSSPARRRAPPVARAPPRPASSGPAIHVADVFFRPLPSLAVPQPDDEICLVTARAGHHEEVAFLDRGDRDLPRRGPCRDWEARLECAANSVESVFSVTSRTSSAGARGRRTALDGGIGKRRGVKGEKRRGSERETPHRGRAISASRVV